MVGWWGELMWRVAFVPGVHLDARLAEAEAKFDKRFQDTFALKAEEVGGGGGWKGRSDQERKRE